MGIRPSLCIPPLGTVTASGFFHCPVGYSTPLTMAPKSKPAPTASAADSAADSGTCDTPSADSAGDIIRLVMEQLQLLHARMDDQDRTQSELLRRDALRNHPAPIDAAPPPLVANEYRPTNDAVHAPTLESSLHDSASRRPTIDT